MARASRSKAKPRSDHQGEHDPGAELGLKSPVRDSERLGDAKYEVTPPRSAVRPAGHVEPVSCRACQAAIDPRTSYRADGEEYVFHFCSARCYERWHGPGE